MTDPHDTPDWRAMEAGRRLDLEIAVRLGLDVMTKPLPLYSTSVDAALTLPLPNDGYFSIIYEPRRSLVSLDIGADDHPLCEATTLALAVCRAWLSWQETRTTAPGDLGVE
jgi:hypothetical protein